LALHGNSSGCFWTPREAKISNCLTQTVICLNFLAKTRSIEVHMLSLTYTHQLLMLWDTLYVPTTIRAQNYGSFSRFFPDQQQKNEWGFFGCLLKSNSGLWLFADIFFVAKALLSAAPITASVTHQSRMVFQHKHRLLLHYTEI
jgi:hypothetical protein